MVLHAQPVQIGPVALFEKHATTTAGPVQSGFWSFFWLHGLDLQTLIPYIFHPPLPFLSFQFLLAVPWCITHNISVDWYSETPELTSCFVLFSYRSNLDSVHHFGAHHEGVSKIFAPLIRLLTRSRSTGCGLFSAPTSSWLITRGSAEPLNLHIEPSLRHQPQIPIRNLLQILQHLTFPLQIYQWLRHQQCQLEESAWHWHLTEPDHASFFASSVTWTSFQIHNKLSKEEKKEYVVYYTDFETKQTWKLLKEYSDATKTYLEFRTEIPSHYLDATREYIYSIRDMDMLLGEWQCLCFNNTTKLSEFHLQFIVITNWLISQKQLSDLEQKWSCLCKNI